MVKYILPLVLILIFSASCKKDPVDDIDNSDDDNKDTTETVMAQDTVKINEIQILASHNSYRKRTYDPIFDAVQNLSGILPSSLNPEEWDYMHPPFEVQFEYNVRGLEIDIYNDPNGGQFSNRQGLDFAGEPTESGIAALDEPGYKVIHVPDLDYETNYLTFIDALEALKSWSDQNPNHIPMFIYVEAKESGVADVVSLNGFAETIPYSPSAANALDEEVKSVFGMDLAKVITPDEVRGDFATLNEAVKAGNWPLLKDSRGKFMFIISGNEMIDNYTQGKPNLEGRAMFVFGPPDETYTACLLRNGPLGNESTIAAFVEEGYIVRTRADNGVSSAKGQDDYSRANAAFASGAQIVTTDYYRPDIRSDTSSIWTDFQVQLPNNDIARFNPVNAPEILESNASISE